MDKGKEKIVDRWLFHAFKSGDLRLPQKATHEANVKDAHAPTAKNKKNKKGARDSALPTNPADLEALHFLETAGFAQRKKGEWRILNEFVGFLSVARSGIAFVQASARHEAIVPHADRGPALHRDKVKVRITGFNRGRFTAKVVEIVEPFSGEYLASILGAARGVGGKGDLYLAELIDLPDRPQVLVKAERAPQKLAYLRRTATQKQYLREIKDRGYARSQAFLFEISPRKITQDRKGDLERLRLRYMLPGPFEKALVPLKKHLDKAVKAELKNAARVHVKDRYIFTIDGEDAKDFDDAIACRETERGYELDVHIADVGFFVKPDTPLFAEALKRGNSYYLAGSVIPMLPEILSNEFCSLKPKTHRLAFSVRMHFDHAGKMVDYELFKSVIYINKRFTYNEAHKALQKKGSPIEAAMRLAQILIDRRDSEGRVDLNIAEQKAVYDKKGAFVGLASETRLESHRLVEEAMLSANQAVANYAIRHKVHILHRNHESMPVDKLDRLNRYLEKYVAKLKLRSVEQKEIGRILSDQRLDSVRSVFQYLLLRSFMQAQYAPEAKGHWGLAFHEYAHFTSPIRRFADLVTHLELAAHLANSKALFPFAELDSFGREASRLERIAFEAERADKKLLAVRALAHRVNQTFDVWLSGFSSERLFVTLVEFPAEGEIEAAAVDKRGEIQVLDDFSVFAGKLQKTLSLGDRFKAKLVKADPLAMSLSFVFSLP